MINGLNQSELKNIDMEKELFNNADDKTPLINFNAETGLMQIHGSSLPENPIEFYEPIINWLNKYIENPNDKTVFDYFDNNTSHYITEALEAEKKKYLQSHSSR
mgnify:CR=1 FL=1